MVDDVVAQVLTDPVGVPDRPGQQMLHAIRRGLAGMLGECPAVLARQVGQQREQEPADPTPPLDPGEPAGDPIQQLVHACRPASRPYPGPRPPRDRPMSSHLTMVTRWPPSSADQDQAIYGWSTN